MSLRVLIQKLAEATKHDDSLIALAERVYDVLGAIEAVAEDDYGAERIFYDWAEAEKTVQEAEYHSKHAKALLPHLKKLGDDAKQIQKYIDDIIKKCGSVSAREAEEGDLDDSDLEREDDFGHKWKDSPHAAVRDKQAEFDDKADDLVKSFQATAQGFKEFKEKQGHHHSFDDLVGVNTKDRDYEKGAEYLEGDHEEAAGLMDAWQDEVKWFRQHAEQALAVAKKLTGDLPEV